MAHTTFPPVAILHERRQNLINYITRCKEDIQELNKQSISLASEVDAMEAQVKEFDMAISLLEKI